MQSKEVPQEYVPLHVVSNFSLLGTPKKLAVSSPETLVKRAKESGFQSVGIADTTIASLGYFLRAEKTEGVSVLPGMELAVHIDGDEEATDVLVLPRNLSGFEFLARLATEQSVDERKLTPQDLYNRQSTEEVILFWSGFDDRTHEYLQDSSTFYGIHEPTSERTKIARRIDTQFPGKTVVTHEVRLSSPHDLALYHALEKIYPGLSPESGITSPLNATLKQPLEIAALYPRLPHAIARTKEIAQSCDVQFPLRVDIKAKIAEGKDSYQFLESLILSAMQKKMSETSGLDALPKRVLHENSMIKELEFADYLLICYEIATFCNERHIPFLVSGSGNNSVDLWLLGVVKVDPQTFYFERFMSEERRYSLPDVDFLFPKEGKENVVSFLLDRYPNDATHMAVIKHPRSDGITLFEKKGGETLTTKERQSIVEAEIPLYLVKHPSGIIFQHQYPRIKLTSGINVAPWDTTVAEKVFHLLKFDLLTSQALSHKAYTDQAIHIQGGSSEIPKTDKEAFKRLFTGDTVSIVTAETPHLQRVLKDMQAVGLGDMEHLAQALALARLPSDARNTYFENAQMRNHPFELYPELQAILRHTHNTLIYQEQIERLAIEVAGMTKTEGEKLRKMMSEKVDEETKTKLLSVLQDRLRLKGYPVQVQSLLLRQLMYFQSYSFVEGHSHTLALAAYEQAFLVTHYPKEYWSGVLGNIGSTRENLLYHPQVYINEAHRHGVAFLFPPYEALPPVPSVAHSGITAGRNLFGALPIKKLQPLYTEFLDILKNKSSEECITFQMKHFPYVLTGNPSQLVSEKYHFKPEVYKQIIVGQIGLVRRFNDLYFMTLDANTLIHTSVSQDVLRTQGKHLFTHQKKLEGSFCKVEIGKSTYRDDEWVLLKIFPTLDE